MWLREPWVRAPLPPGMVTNEFQASNSGCQPLQQALLPTKPFHLPFFSSSSILSSHVASALRSLVKHVRPFSSILCLFVSASGLLSLCSRLMIAFFDLSWATFQLWESISPPRGLFHFCLSVSLCSVSFSSHVRFGVVVSVTALPSLLIQYFKASQHHCQCLLLLLLHGTTFLDVPESLCWMLLFIEKLMPCSMTGSLGLGWRCSFSSIKVLHLFLTVAGKYCCSKTELKLEIS